MSMWAMQHLFTNERDWGKKQVIVEVSCDVLKEFFTKGWHGDGVECVTGLPPTAKFVRMFSGRMGEAINLVFEDESFEEARGSIPYISVSYKQTLSSPEDVMKLKIVDK